MHVCDHEVVHSYVLQRCKYAFIEPYSHMYAGVDVRLNLCTVLAVCIHVLVYLCVCVSAYPSVYGFMR